MDGFTVIEDKRYRELLAMERNYQMVMEYISDMPTDLYDLFGPWDWENGREIDNSEESDKR